MKKQPKLFSIKNLFKNNFCKDKEQIGIIKNSNKISKIKKREQKIKKVFSNRVKFVLDDIFLTSKEKKNQENIIIERLKRRENKLI